MTRIPFILSLISLIMVSSPLQARTFKIATLAPDGTAWMKNIRAGADLIKQKTRGRVNFKFYTGGIMGSDDSMLKKIRIGQLQGGAITGGGLARVYPDTQIYSLPFLFRSFEEVDFVRKTMDAELREGLHDKGIKVLGISEGGFAYFMSGKPVRKLEDLSGLKNWLPEGDELSSVMYETAGITPVQLPISDVYTGLQTGLIDTVGVNETGAIAFQWHTKVKYVADIPIMYLVGTLVLDQKAFDKIKPDDQKIVTEVMADVFKKLDTINREDNLKAREALKQEGIKFISLTHEEAQHWYKLAEKMRKTMIEKGLYSEKMYKELTSLLQDYRKKNLTHAK